MSKTQKTSDFLQHQLPEYFTVTNTDTKNREIEVTADVDGRVSHWRICHKRAGYYELWADGHFQRRLKSDDDPSLMRSLVNTHEEVDILEQKRMVGKTLCEYAIQGGILPESLKLKNTTSNVSGGIMTLHVNGIEHGVLKIITYVERAIIEVKFYADLRFEPYWIEEFELRDPNCAKNIAQFLNERFSPSHTSKEE